MFKKILLLFAILFIISAIAAPVYADQTVFGPEDLTIGNLYVHLSSHQFSVDDPSDGVLTIVKNTPDKEIWGGFCVLNGKYIGLSDFLNGTGTIFEEDVDLRSNSRITIFLGGIPDASIKVEVKKKGLTPPPEVTFTADPATIYVGQSSTLSWTSTNADTCSIEPGIGSVDLNGSTAVSPTETTSYTITATGTGGTATASATVTIANSAPVANDQTVTLNEDETASITLTASDANGDALTYEIVSNPSHGTLTGTAPNLTYTPSSNYNGSDTFTFKANDGSLDSNIATVTLAIQPVNDSPTAADDTVTTNEDTAIAAIAVLTNDTDPDGDTLTIDDFTQPAHGTAGSNGDGTLTYTPGINYNGTDSFTYTVSDGNGSIDTATVNITVNPVNDAPVANDQTVTLNEDETASIILTASDAEGDTLTYQIVSNPSHGTLTGSTPDITYTPFENYNGSDAFTFKVNDGNIDTGDATVTITVNPVNDPPVSDAGPDQTALQGNVVTLNGNGSSDIDDDTLTYSWTFTSVPTGSTATLSDSSTANPSFTADMIGAYEIRLIINDGTVNSTPDTVTINIVALPTVEISANPTTILTGESSTLTWTSTHADTCMIEPGIGIVALNSSTTISPTETTTYTITAANAGGTATASVTVTVNQPPTVNFSASPATIAQGGSSELFWTSNNAQSAHIDNGIGSVSVNGSVTVNPEHTTTYTISVTGAAGNASAKSTVKVTGNPALQPEGSFGEQYEDLVPPDSTVDEYDPKRFSLITGIVHAIDDSPVQAVSVTIHSHPEYGTVLTDTTGRFSIPVEGGGTITIVYQKEGLITSHRKVYVPWNDIAIAETIQMIAEDPVSTTFTFDGSPDTVVTHKSSEVIDEFGSRSCSMVFTGDNSAWLVDENGNDIKELETITVKASEYATENSMPAKLPPNSAYTYCVELAVDGAERVRFEKPVITWVENFLGFDVGIPVPVGYYDRDRGVWVPEENGIVVKLLDTDSDGIVDALDADGDDQPDDITGDGSFTDEAIGLDDNAVYAPGTTYWRVAIAHFSPSDCNWPQFLENYPIGPNANGKPSVEIKEPCFVEGTLVKIGKGFRRIEDIAKGDLVLSQDENKNNTVFRKVVRTVVTENQKILELRFHDEKDIVETIGTTDEHPFWVKERGWVAAGELRTGDKVFAFGNKWTTLAESNRLIDRQTVYNIEVEDLHTYFVGKSGIWVHNTCKKMVNPRKRTLDTDIDLPGTGLTLHYASDRVEGYKTNITVPASGSSVPAYLKQIVVKVEIAGRTMIQHLDPLPNQIAFFEWDGLDHLSRPVDSARAKIHIGFVYDSLYSFSFDFAMAFGQPGEILTGVSTRNEATMWWEEKISVHSKYNILKDSIAKGWALSVHHYLDPLDTSILHKGNGETIENNSSIIYTVAGNGTVNQVAGPMGIAIDKEGNIYFAEKNYHRIRKVDKDGNITTVAGTGSAGYDGNSGPASGRKLNYPEDIAVDDSGNLYITDTENNMIRKVNKDGILESVLQPGGLINVNSPSGVAVDISGNLYIADTGNHRIRKVDPNGIITTIAGNGTFGFSGDGGLAKDAQLYGPKGLAVDNYGNLYIADEWNHRIRKVDTSGVITTVAGSGPIGNEVNMYIWGDDDYVVDNIPATEIKLYRPNGIAIDSTGCIYIASRREYYDEFLPIFSIRKINPAGIITTIAGNGSEGFTGDGGLATAAQIGSCRGVAIDSNGSVYITAGYNRIRRVNPVIASASYITAGDIFTTDPKGLGYIMSSSGRHKTTIDLENEVVLNQFDYDVNNNLVSVTDKFSNQVIIERDGNGVPVSIVSPDGITTSLAIDGNNHLTGITYPDGSNYSFEYTPDGIMTAMIDPEGNRFDYTYDSIGRLTNASDEEGGSWQYSMVVNNNGGILSEVLSAEGNLTSYLDYTDSSGASISTITSPDSEQTVMSAPEYALTLNKTLPCDVEMAFKYDLDSEYLTKYVKESIITMPSSLAMTTTRGKVYEDTDTDDTPDLLTETVTVNGKATSLVNNVLQSEKTITTPEARTVTMQYDPATLLTESLSIPGLNTTNYGYNPQGRLTSVSTGTRATTFSYNTQGFMDSFTDPEGYTTTYTHDAVGRVTGIGRPDGSSLGFTYDGNGNMTVLTNPSSIQHGFGFNKVNLNSSYQTPISGTYSYEYDKDRRLVQTNFPSGRQIRNIYDTIKLSQVQTPEGNIDYTYLCSTTVGSITKGTEAITFGYDGKLVTSIDLTGTLAQSLGFTYNNDFNVTGFTYAGDTENYTYDYDGLLTGAGSFTITRNVQNGLPESVSGGTLSQSRTFNGYGEQDGQVSIISGQDVSSWSLAQDDNGQITQKIETVDGNTSTYDYTYDPMGRLITVTKDGSLVEEYDYDINGTRIYEMNTLRGITGRSFTYSDEDHLLTAGTASYQYDVDGFLTTKTDGTDTTSYNYSSRGELLSVTLPDGKVIEYIHDPMGRRVAKIVDGTTVEKYLWQGSTRLLAVYDGTDNLMMRFEYADGRMPVAMTRGGATYYLAYDQVGSLKAVADSTGNVVKRIDYDSFGNIIADTDPSFDMPFGFARGLHDQDTGLVRFGYRDYDPDIGRWTAKDPILFAGGDTDLFGYVLNDPVDVVDPLGLAGIAIDFGGDYSSGWGGKVNPNSFINQGESAGTGIYLGAKSDGYAELGGFTYRSYMSNSGLTPSAAIGAGANITLYFTDAEKFFQGKMEYINYVIGPFSLTFSIDPCTDDLTGVTGSFLGKGFGWAIHEKGISSGIQGALQ